MADTSLATAQPNAGANPPRMDSLKSLVQTPVARQLLLLVGVAAAVAIGVAVVLWSRTPNYGLLYGNLTQKDAAAISQQLQAGGTPYRLSPDGGSIMVPSASIPSLRLKLASQGLPHGSAQTAAGEGNGSPFGMSDLAERSHYQQLLENDLGSTISSLDSIRSARVHLAMPKPSAFIRNSSPASASVVVSLFPGRQLGSSQVAAIVHLVAASVPGLDPRHVSVIDQQGQLLTTDDPDSPAAIGDHQLRLTSRIEDDYAHRIEALLTPLVGASHVRAQVFADVDFSQSEKASETYGPNQGLLRSEQVSSSQRTGSSSQGAVPGALSNQPPATVSQPTAANPAGGPGNTTASKTTKSPKNGAGQPVDESSHATRNYELDRTIAHVTDPAGRISRLTVAVVVDNKQVVGKNGKLVSKPFSAAELQRMTALVKNAVGFDAKRGDSVSVINEAFRATPQDNTPVSTPFWQRPGMADMIKEGGGILLVLALVFGLLRPILRGLLKPAQPEPPVQQAITRDEDEDAGIEKPQKLAPAIAYEQQLGLAKRMAAENPKQVAQVVKNWVATDGS